MTDLGPDRLRPNGGPKKKEHKEKHVKKNERKMQTKDRVGQSILVHVLHVVVAHKCLCASRHFATLGRTYGAQFTIWNVNGTPSSACHHTDSRHRQPIEKTVTLEQCHLERRKLEPKWHQPAFLQKWYSRFLGTQQYFPQKQRADTSWRPFLQDDLRRLSDFFLDLVTKVQKGVLSF